MKFYLFLLGVLLLWVYPSEQYVPYPKPSEAYETAIDNARTYNIPFATVYEKQEWQSTVDKIMALDENVRQVQTKISNWAKHIEADLNVDTDVIPILDAVLKELAESVFTDTQLKDSTFTIMQSTLISSIEAYKAYIINYNAHRKKMVVQLTLKLKEHFYYELGQQASDEFEENKESVENVIHDVISSKLNSLYTTRVSEIKLERFLKQEVACPEVHIFLVECDDKEEDVSKIKKAIDTSISANEVSINLKTLQLSSKETQIQVLSPLGYRLVFDTYETCRRRTSDYLTSDDGKRIAEAMQTEMDRVLSNAVSLVHKKYEFSEIYSILCSEQWKVRVYIDVFLSYSDLMTLTDLELDVLRGLTLDAEGRHYWKDIPVDRKFELSEIDETSSAVVPEIYNDDFSEFYTFCVVTIPLMASVIAVLCLLVACINMQRCGCRKYWTKLEEGFPHY